MTERPFAAQAMILAAGRGSRMRPLTDTCPKPLLTVQGKPLLRWHSDALAAQGFGLQVVNAGWLHEQIADYVAQDWAQSGGRRIHLSDEVADFGHALETLGGVLRALPHLADCFWVVAGDVYAPDFVFAPELMAQFAASSALAHVFLVPNPAHNPKGDFGLSEQGLLQTLDAAAAGQPSYTFSTIALYKKALFAAPYCSLPVGNPQGEAAPLAPLLRQAAQAGWVSASLYAGAWTDVGTPERLAALNAETNGV